MSNETGIPQEILNTHMFSVNAESDVELMFMVQHYNAKMDKRRRKLMSVFRLEKIMLSLNIVLILFVSTAMGHEPIFIFDPRIEWLEWTALGVYAAGFIVLGIWKKEFILFTVVSAALILTDFRYIVLVGLNAVFTLLREISFRKLKKEEGFPLFRRISVSPDAAAQAAVANNDISMIIKDAQKAASEEAPADTAKEEQSGGGN